MKKIIKKAKQIEKPYYDLNSPSYELMISTNDMIFFKSKNKNIAHYIDLKNEEHIIRLYNLNLTVIEVVFNYFVKTNKAKLDNLNNLITIIIDLATLDNILSKI